MTLRRKERASLFLFTSSEHVSSRDSEGEDQEIVRQFSFIHFLIQRAHERASERARACEREKVREGEREGERENN